MAATVVMSVVKATMVKAWDGWMERLFWVGSDSCFRVEGLEGVGT
jgi:hypothetical protein